MTRHNMLKTKNETFAFFGSGVDMLYEEIDRTYHSLLDSYNLIQRRIEEKKAQDRNRPLIQIPRISIPFLGINIGGDPEPAKIETADDSTTAISQTETLEK